MEKKEKHRRQKIFMAQQREDWEGNIITMIT